MAEAARFLLDVPDPAVPVIAVYHCRFGGRIARLEVAVSADGLLVWREPRGRSDLWRKPAEDGSVLLQATVDTGRVAGLLARLADAGVFRERSFGYVYGTPDGSETHIHLSSAAGSLIMDSWHELIEQDPRRVATDRGVRTLALGETRADVLAGCSEEYRTYRAVWSLIRSTLAEWIPDGGEPYAGSLDLSRRRSSRQAAK